MQLVYFVIKCTAVTHPYECSIVKPGIKKKKKKKKKKKHELKFIPFGRSIYGAARANACTFLLAVEFKPSK